jgi:hypothetical protein
MSNTVFFTARSQPFPTHHASRCTFHVSRYPRIPTVPQHTPDDALWSSTTLTGTRKTTSTLIRCNLRYPGRGEDALNGLIRDSQLVVSEAHDSAKRAVAHAPIIAV